MTEKLNIVQSTTEPDKRNIWLKDNELKKFGTKGWSTIGGKGGGNAGGGIDTFEIEVDFENNCIIFNDKSFNGNYSSSSIGDVIHIYSIELYNILKNNLINTYKPVFIKSSSNDSRYIFTPASCIIAEDRCTFYIHTSEVTLAIIIHNENEDE